MAVAEGREEGETLLRVIRVVVVVGCYRASMYVEAVAEAGCPECLLPSLKKRPNH